ANAGGPPFVTGRATDHDWRWLFSDRTGQPTKCLEQFPFGTCQSESEFDLSPPPRTLIEEAESRLETPRWGSRVIVSSPRIDRSVADDWPRENNRFSTTWSNGAPLLLFDWSGKS